MSEIDPRADGASDDGPVDPRSELRSLAAGLRRHAERFERMGIYAARGRGRARAAEDAGESWEQDVPAPQAPAARPEGLAAAALQVVRDDLGECTRCKLSATRTKIVFGIGAPEADLLFIGEAPGAEEDRRGEPFVGAAGQLLDKMIAAMGWTREAVYIANVLKCRPPGNRDPEPDEVTPCLPFLRRQIEAIRPRVIVALGRPSAQTLLQTNAPISALRGRFHRFGDVPLMPTFHPAYLLRTPDRKRDAWSDLKQVMEELERQGVRAPNQPRS
jgi:DNA polymerase